VASQEAHIHTKNLLSNSMKSQLTNQSPPVKIETTKCNLWLIRRLRKVLVCPHTSQKSFLNSNAIFTTFLHINFGIYGMSRRNAMRQDPGARISQESLQFHFA